MKIGSWYSEFNDFNHFIRITAQLAKQKNKRVALLSLRHNNHLVADLTEIDENNKIKQGKTIKLGTVNSSTAFYSEKVLTIAQQFAGVATPFLNEMVADAIVNGTLSPENIDEITMPLLQALLIDSFSERINDWQVNGEGDIRPRLKYEEFNWTGKFDKNGFPLVEGNLVDINTNHDDNIFVHHPEQIIVRKDDSWIIKQTGRKLNSYNSADLLKKFDD